MLMVLYDEAEIVLDNSCQVLYLHRVVLLEGASQRHQMVRFYLRAPVQSLLIDLEVLAGLLHEQPQA